MGLWCVGYLRGKDGSITVALISASATLATLIPRSENPLTPMNATSLLRQVRRQYLGERADGRSAVEEDGGAVPDQMSRKGLIIAGRFHGLTVKHQSGRYSFEMKWVP